MPDQELPEHPWGNTAPCLKIARLYGVPWEVPLSLVDKTVHGRKIPERVLVMLLEIGPEKRAVIRDACDKVARHTLALFARGDAARAEAASA